MNQTLSVVYVGPKSEKRIARGGLRFRFPVGEAVEVEEQIAYDLLRHTGVFATPQEAETLMQVRQQHEDEATARRLEAKRQAELEAVANSYLVQIDGETVDISKYPKAKLATVVEVEALEIDANKPEMKSGESKPEALRNRIRDALHDKYGNPAEAA